MPFSPPPGEVREIRLIDDRGDRLVDVMPHLSERRVLFPFAFALGILGAFHVPDHLTHGDGFRRARQQVASFGSPPRFHESALLEPGQNQFQEFLGDLLPAGDIGDLYRYAPMVHCQIEYGLQSVLALN